MLCNLRVNFLVHKRQIDSPNDQRYELWLGLNSPLGQLFAEIICGRNNNKHYMNSNYMCIRKVCTKQNFQKNQWL